MPLAGIAHGVEQFVFNPHECFGVFEFGSFNQKHVFGALVKRGNLGRCQIDAVSRKNDGDGVQQPQTVIAGDLQYPALLTLVAFDLHNGPHRETAASPTQFPGFWNGQGTQTEP